MEPGISWSCLRCLNWFSFWALQSSSKWDKSRHFRRFSGDESVGVCKGRCKRGNIAAETIWVNVAHSVVWVSKRERSKPFLLPRRKFCVFKICCLDTQTRKHLGNIQSQCFFSVSRVIPRLLPHATYVEDTKSASWKQKMLLKFSKNIFCVLDAFLLPQQCFLVCASLNNTAISLC